jgi:hypothetical protein
VHSEIDAWLIEEMWRSQQRFGHKAARLYPLLGRKVRSPEGRGKLWQVLARQAGVVLDRDPETVVFMGVEGVKLPNEPMVELVKRRRKAFIYAVFRRLSFVEEVDRFFGFVHL